MTNLDLTFASGETSLTVTRFAVQEAVSTLFTASIWALSEDPSIDLDALVGRPAAFRIDSGAAAAPLGGRRRWTGLCEHAALLKAEPTGNSAYFFRVVPATWLLTQRRRLLMVKDDRTGKRLYFRFYDPPMLRLFLPTCGVRQREQVFGEIEAFLVEGRDGEVVRLGVQGAPGVLTGGAEAPTLELEA